MAQTSNPCRADDPARPQRLTLSATNAGTRRTTMLLWTRPAVGFHFAFLDEDSLKMLFPSACSAWHIQACFPLEQEHVFFLFEYHYIECYIEAHVVCETNMDLLVRRMVQHMSASAPQNVPFGTCGYQRCDLFRWAQLQELSELCMKCQIPSQAMLCI